MLSVAGITGLLLVGGGLLRRKRARDYERTVRAAIANAIKELCDHETAHPVPYHDLARAERIIHVTEQRLHELGVTAPKDLRERVFKKLGAWR